MIDIKCYRANYDKAGWEKITEGWTKCNVMPGAILAVNALCDEVERLQQITVNAHHEILRGNDKKALELLESAYKTS